MNTNIEVLILINFNFTYLCIKINRKSLNLQHNIELVYCIKFNIWFEKKYRKCYSKNIKYYYSYIEKKYV